MEYAQLAQHVLQVNKNPEVALDLLTLHVQHALLVVQTKHGQTGLVRELNLDTA